MLLLGRLLAVSPDPSPKQKPVHAGENNIKYPGIQKHHARHLLKGMRRRKDDDECSILKDSLPENMRNILHRIQLRDPVFAVLRPAIGIPEQINQNIQRIDGAVQLHFPRHKLAPHPQIQGKKKGRCRSQRIQQYDNSSNVLM